MSEGDPEPGFLCSKTVYNVAKFEEKNSNLLHQDPVKALQILKEDSADETIRYIWYIPFSVGYWTNHQLSVYKTYTRKGPSCLAIDATGGVVQNIARMKKQSTSPMFLYIGMFINYC